MKLRFTLSSFTLLLFAVILMSHSGGRATQFGEGNTGAPGDDSKTCGTCHSGGDFGAEMVIELLNANSEAVTMYKPGMVYTVQATINTSTTPAGYGLQMVGIFDGSEENAGTLANPSDNAQLADANGRTYVEQAGLSSSETFTAEWTAPAEGNGAVTFYGFGHAANGNGGSNGDQATGTSLQIEEDVTSSTKELVLENVMFQPNPTSSFTTIVFEQNTQAHVIIMDITGKKHKSFEVNGKESILDLQDLNAGIYFAKIVDIDNRSKTVRIIKR